MTKKITRPVSFSGVAAAVAAVATLLATTAGDNIGRAEAPAQPAALPQVPSHIPAAKTDGIIYLKGADGVDRATTLDPILQEQLTRFLIDNQTPIAGIVLTDIKTGNVLAMAQGRDPATWGGRAHTALHKGFPAASVFKTVVTAAAMEIADLDATEPVGLSGGCSHVRESGEWLLGRESERAIDPAGEMSLRRAFGSSCNGFFAKIALSRLGLGAITNFAKKLGWENGVPADFAIERSPFFPPTPQNSSAHTVGAFAAGFGYVGLSAAHAAWLMQTIANDGVGKPLRLFRDTPDAPGERLLAPETAKKLLALLDASVKGGTASFAYRRGKYKKLRDLVGGKTGTLTGNSPKGLTTWFAGIAPLDAPQVAVAAVVMLEDHWRIKGPLLAAEGLYDYFELKAGAKPSIGAINLLPGAETQISERR